METLLTAPKWLCKQVCRTHVKEGLPLPAIFAICLVCFLKRNGGNIGGKTPLSARELLDVQAPWFINIYSVSNYLSIVCCFNLLCSSLNSLICFWAEGIKQAYKIPILSSSLTILLSAVVQKIPTQGKTVANKTLWHSRLCEGSAKRVHKTTCLPDRFNEQNIWNTTTVSMQLLWIKLHPCSVIVMAELPSD